MHLGHLQTAGNQNTSLSSDAKKRPGSKIFIFGGEILILFFVHDLKILIFNGKRGFIDLPLTTYLKQPPSCLLIVWVKRSSGKFWLSRLGRADSP